MSQHFPKSACPDEKPGLSRRGMSRRSFLKTAAVSMGALVGLMAHPTTEAEAAETRVARFIIGSDVHIPAYNSPNKLPVVLQWMSGMAPDRICLVGDIVDQGLQSYYDQLNAILSASPFSSDIQGSFVFSQGNHETYSVGVDGAPALFTSNLGQEPNKLLSVNGVPVITLGPNSGSDSNYANDYDDLSDYLSTIESDTTTYTPGMPILVLCHHSIPNTAYASPEWHGSYGNLIDLMQGYPQIIHVSGHSHSTIEDARSIDQSLGFTCIQDSTLCAYYENERNHPDMYDRETGENSSYPQVGDDFNKASQCIVLDVLSSGKSTVTRYDLYPLMEGGQARQLYEPWTIDTSNLKYQPTRTCTTKPVKPAGEATVSDVTETTMAVSFPAFSAGSDANEDMVHDYRIIAQPVDENGENDGDAEVRRYFADYYLPASKQSSSFKLTVAGLASNTKYRVSVYADTSFEQLSDDLTLLADPLVVADVVQTNALAVPTAILDIDFRLGTAADAMGHELSDRGGSLVLDDTLIAGVSTPVFESNGQGGYGYQLAESDYLYFREASTFECLFKMVDTSGSQAVFSCQQSAGAGFEVDDGTLSLWYNVDGSYKQASTAIQPGEWIHAVAVNDNGLLTLYVNGAQVSQVTSGTMKIPGPKIYYVGCDTNSSGNPEFLTTQGTRVALARLYPRAFTADEVASAYTDAMKSPEGVLLDVDYRNGSAEDACGHPSKLWDSSSIEDVTLPNGSTGKALVVGGAGGYSYTLNENDYNRFREVSTTECVFKMVDVNADQCVLSNQQSAGSGFEIENGNLEYWFNLETGENPKPSAAIQADEWVHAVATFDGATLNLYLNGQLADTKAAVENTSLMAASTIAGSGASVTTMKVPSPKAYFVGADTTSSEEPSYEAASGTQVALARLYTRVLGADEIATRYNELITASSNPDDSDNTDGGDDSDDSDNTDGDGTTDGSDTTDGGGTTDGDGTTDGSDNTDGGGTTDGGDALPGTGSQDTNDGAGTVNDGDTSGGQQQSDNASKNPANPGVYKAGSKGVPATGDFTAFVDAAAAAAMLLGGGSIAAGMYTRGEDDSEEDDE